jgi:surface protein
MNSGGSSSKGGKTNDRRRLVEAAKAQLQRKLQCEKKCFGSRDELRSAVDDYLKYGCHLMNFDESIRLNCEFFFVTTKGYGLPMNDWCVDNVTNMYQLFSNKYQFNEDISKWKTGKVTNMEGMFRYAYKFNQDVSRWDVSQVTNMKEMFWEAFEFNQDVSRWDVSKVTDMTRMFTDAFKFNQDISIWNVSQVQFMSSMFAGASSFNADVSSWDISRVESMNKMFFGASSFNRDLCKWADKFPYGEDQWVFLKTNCKYQSDPEKENGGGGPFCASDCKS